MIGQLDDTTGVPPDVAEVIARAKRELEHMIDMNPQSMMLVRTDGTVLRANRALLRLLACRDFAEILDRPLQDIFQAREEDLFQNLMEGKGGGKGLKSSVALRSGRSHILRFCLLGMGQASDFHVVIVEDVTETSIVEAAANKELKREAVQALMGALTHNLNQPLTVISVRTKLLSLALERGQTLDGAVLTETLEEITRASMRIAEILRKAERPHDYVTETYVEGLEILDLQGSGG